MTKAEEIIELFKREPFHPDPQVHQQILKTSIEDILDKYVAESSIVRRLYDEIDDLEEVLHEIRGPGAAA